MHYSFRRIAEVSLRFEGAPVPVSKDGWLGKFNRAGMATLSVKLTPTPAPGTIALVPYMEQGVKVSKKHAEEDGSYELKIPVKQANRSTSYHTERLQNHLDVLHLEREGENVRLLVWEVSLVSQYGNFFLAVEERDSALLYGGKDGGILYSEEYMMKSHPFWANFREFAGCVIQGKNIPLPSAERMPAVKGPENAKDLPPNMGVCIYFRLSHGIGMILTREHGMVAVHYSAIRQNGSRLTYLMRGSRVHYNGVTDKVNTWQHESQFKLQAFGVSPVV